ncbi:hypothetical protein ACTFIV_005443 [Dictyostelium citrinum]
MDTKIQSQFIYIPIRGFNDQALKIDISSLPDSKELIEVLKAELAPLDLWLKLANEYYKQDRITDFIEVLKQVTDADLEQYYKDSKLDRIAMLNALASYYTQLGSQEKDKSRREEYFSNATFHFTKADRIDPHQPLTWIGKAVLLLTKGDYERAESNFKQVLDLAKSNNTLPVLPAKLGSACILFNQGNYIKALDTYQKVIQQNSNCLPSVRLGLGYCYFKLGRSKKAKEAFKRVLELDRDNVEAMIGLALVLMNENQIPEAMKLILSAYQLAPTNSIVLNHLANHYFFRGEYNKVNTLGVAAFNNTDVAHIKAESAYLIGRAFHATQRWQDAIQYYHQAVQKNPDLYLAQFGLGQIHIHNEDYDKAILCFEQVLSKQPNNYETLQILGSLYKHGSLYKSNVKTTTITTTSSTTTTNNNNNNLSNEIINKIKNVLKKATELNPNDSSNWFELGQLLESTEVSTALEAYEKGLNLLKKDGITPSLEIQNNIAVLRHQKGLLVEAEQTYLDIIKQSGYQLNQFKAINITSTYNLARLYETMGQVNKAEELYKGIIKEHPNYYDCYLRLSCICKQQGDYYEAGEWIREVLDIQPDNQEAWALYGNLHLYKEEWYPAQKNFEQITENPENKNETYASLSLGNIYYNAKFSNPDKVEKYILNAEQFYNRVLTKNPTNIYAANGIGMIIAEKGNLNLASETFLQIREASMDCIPVSVNLAHIYVSKGLYDNAIKLYEGCLKKSTSPKEIETIIMYLAKVYFDANRFYDSKQTLKKAIHMYPHNLSIHFNLAISIEMQATIFLEKHQKNAAETNNIIKELEFAQRLLTPLANTKPTPKLNFNPSKAKTHQTSIEKILVRLRTEYESIVKIEADLSKKREAAFEEVKRLEEEKRVRELELKQQLEEKLEAERKLAFEEEEKTREEMAKNNAATAIIDDDYKDGGEGSTTKKRKKNKKDQQDDELDDQPTESKKKQKKEKKEKKEKKKKSKKGNDDQDDGEGDNEQETMDEDGGHKEKKKKKKSKKDRKDKKDKKQKKKEKKQREKEEREGDDDDDDDNAEDDDNKEEQDGDNNEKVDQEIQDAKEAEKQKEVEDFFGSENEM